MGHSVQTCGERPGAAGILCWNLRDVNPGQLSYGAEDAESKGSPSIPARSHPPKNTGNFKDDEKFLPGLKPRLRVLFPRHRGTSYTDHPGWLPCRETVISRRDRRKLRSRR